MAEASGKVWLRQAWSDLEAARTLRVRKRPEFCCQVVSKCQQTVEKSIKAVVAALVEQGVLASTIGRKHGTTRFFSQLLRRSPQKPQTKLQGQICGLLNEHRRAEITALENLTPKWPAPGRLFPRNTEYPFQLSDGTWCAPADANSFDWNRDVDRFCSLAEDLCRGCARIVSLSVREPV